MPLDPHVRRLLRLLSAGNPPPQQDLTVTQRRAGLTALMELGGAGPSVAAVDLVHVPGPAGTLPVRMYAPFGATGSPLPGMVFFHGGGQIAGSLDSYDAIARGLCQNSRCRVMAVDYRLAPEHPFPAAVDDALAAVRHIAAHAGGYGIDPRRLVVCGDSAGATLAAVVCQALAGSSCIALQVLLCPLLDYAGESRSWREFGTGYLVEHGTLANDLASYLPPGIDPLDARVSPLRAENLADMPRTQIHTAEFDPLCDDGAAYAERLRQAGCEVSYVCHPGMIHLFYGLTAVIPAASGMLARIGGDIAAAMAIEAVGVKNDEQ